MSILGFRRMNPKERMMFRATLENQRAEASKLYKMNARLQRLFRCACLSGDALRTGFLPMSLFLTMCERCCLLSNTDGAEMNEDLLAPGVTNLALKEQHDDAKKWAAADVSQLSAVLRMMDRTLELNTVEDDVSASPLWARKANDTSINGLSKRRLHNSVAVHNLINKLSDNEIYRREIHQVTRISMQEMFAEIVEEGRDQCNYSEFTALIILLSRHFFTEEEQDQSFVYCVECLWRSYLAPFIEEYSCNVVQDAVARAPLSRFPGMDILLEQLDVVLESLFKLFGVAGSIRINNIQEMISQSGILSEFEHVTLDDVQSVFLDAKSLAANSASLVQTKFNRTDVKEEDEAKRQRERLLAAAAARQDLPRNEIDFSSFVDCLSLLSVLCLAVEPRCSEYPTMASKLEYLIYRFEPLFTSLVGVPMVQRIRPARLEPPKIISIEPSVVGCFARTFVLVKGRNLPSHGLIMKFGSLTMISGPVDHATGSFMCEVPSIARPVNVEIRLNGDDDVVCLVRYHTTVKVSISEDGARFYPFVTTRPFTYEHVDLPIPVRQYLPRLQRIYVQYSTCNGKRPDDIDMVFDKWLQFCRDFRLLPPQSAHDDDASYHAAYQLVVDCFESHAVRIKDPTKAPIEGLRPKEVLALDPTLFPKTLISWIVRSDLPVASTLEEIMGNDLRTARERTIDVRDLNLGPQALRIRRASKKIAMVRRPEGSDGVAHPGSPRDGRVHDIFEGHVLPGGGVGPNGPGPLRARWSNENDHHRFLQRFLASSDHEAQFAGNIELYRVESLPFYNTTLIHDDVEAAANENAGGTSGGAHGANNVDEKDVLARSVQNALTALQREQWNAALRRENAAAYRHSVQTSRILGELKQEQETVEALKTKVALGKKPEGDGALILSAGKEGVLQAEKEELQRIFLYELEKRKAHMQTEMLREEMLRDAERDRAIQNLRDQITDSSTSFQRLQDVAMGQAETIDKQADALRLMADRATQLMADAMYFRGAHEKSVKVIAEDVEPTRAALAEKMLQERTDHILSMNQVSSNMLMEMKDNPNPKHPSAKELAKIPKQMKAALPPLPANYTPPVMPKANAISVMLTAQEAAVQVNEACDQVRHDMQAKIKVLVEKLADAETRANGAEQAADDAMNELAAAADAAAAAPAMGADESLVIEVPSTSATVNVSPLRLRPAGGIDAPGAKSPRGRGVLASPRPAAAPLASPRRPIKVMAEVEVQTDASPNPGKGEEAAPQKAEEPSSPGELTTIALGSLGGDSLQAIGSAMATATVHHVGPRDTFDSIALQYNVPLPSIFSANFVLAPSDDLTGQERDDELLLLLHGIPSKTLRIPNGLQPPPSNVSLGDEKPVAVAAAVRATPVAEQPKEPAAAAGKPPTPSKTPAQEKKQQTPPVAPQQQTKPPSQPTSSSSSGIDKPPVHRTVSSDSALPHGSFPPTPAASAHPPSDMEDSMQPFSDDGGDDEDDNNDDFMNTPSADPDGMLGLHLKSPTPLKPIIDLPNTISVLHSVAAFSAADDEQAALAKKAAAAAAAAKKRQEKPKVRESPSEFRKQQQKQQPDVECVDGGDGGGGDRTPASNVASSRDAPLTPPLLQHDVLESQQLVRMGATLAFEAQDELATTEHTIVRNKSRPSKVLRAADKPEMLRQRAEPAPTEEDCRVLLASPIPLEDRWQLLLHRRHQDFFDAEAHHRLSILLQAEKQFQHVADKLFHALHRGEDVLLAAVASELKHDALLARREALMRQERAMTLVALGKTYEDGARLDALKAQRDADRMRLAEQRREIEASRRVSAIALAKEKMQRVALASERRHPKHIPPIVGRPVVSRLFDECLTPEPVSIPTVEPRTAVDGADGAHAVEGEHTPPPHLHAVAETPSREALPQIGTAKLMPLRMPTYLPKMAQEQIEMVAQAEDLLLTKQLALVERRPHTNGELSPLNLKSTPKSNGRYRKK